MALCAAFDPLFARCRPVAELARGAAAAEEDHFVQAVIVEVNEIATPPPREPDRAEVALTANKLHDHRAMIAPRAAAS